MYDTELTVVGNLITPVDQHVMADGTVKVTFRVASNTRRYDKYSQSWIEGKKLYLTVTAWRELAQNVHSSFRNGDPIIVQGRLATREWEKDGKRQSVTELEATAVGPNLRWSTAVVTRSRRPDAAGTALGTPAAAAGGAGADVEDTVSAGDTYAESGAERPVDDPWGEMAEERNDPGHPLDDPFPDAPETERGVPVEAGVRA